jgi:lycopene cyclase domain-containing protein
MEYFLTLLGFLITGLFMIWRYKLELFNSKKHGWIVLGVVFSLIILWDSVAVYRGYWSFHPPPHIKI